LQVKVFSSGLVINPAMPMMPLEKPDAPRRKSEPRHAVTQFMPFFPAPSGMDKAGGKN